MHGPVWVWSLNYNGPGSDPNATEQGAWNYASRSWTGRSVYTAIRSDVNVRFYMLGIIYK